MVLGVSHTYGWGATPPHILRQTFRSHNLQSKLGMSVKDARLKVEEAHNELESLAEQLR